MAKKRPFADRVLNCVPSRKVETDWPMESAMGAGLLAARPTIPPSKDLRETWWTIGDQKNTGSCVGWASTDSVIRWHFVKASRLPKSERLSSRFVWMASKETDTFVSQPTTFIESEGTSLKAALDISRKFGTVQDSVLPFEPMKLYPGSSQTFYALAARLKIASYFNLGVKVNNWRVWLASNGPVLTRLDVDETWDNAASTGGRLDVYKPETARGGHAIALVGYTRDRFIVRNSWGAGWGDKGFGYASIAYAQAAFTEAYGVSI